MELDGVVGKLLAVTGRLDLVHLNDSKDAFESGRDRHENLGAGQIDLDVLVATVADAATAGVPTIVETPGGVEGQAADIALLRSRLA
jgi:deoxyribonuclease-4